MAIPTATIPAGAVQYAGAPQGSAAMPTAPVMEVAAPTMAPAPMPMSYAAPAMTAPAPMPAPTMPTVSYVPAMMAAPTADMVQAAAPAPVSYAAPAAVPVVAPSYAPVPLASAGVAPSYAPPAMAQVFGPPPAAPVAPPKLTEGIPTPDQIAQQKAGYAVALDKQLVEATTTVKRETELEKQMIKFNADKSIALYAMQVEEALAEQHAITEEQTTIAKLELKKALVERTMQLNAQAANLTLDYQMKAVQTDLAMKQYQFQQQYANRENILAQEYNQQVARANTGTIVR